MTNEEAMDSPYLSILHTNAVPTDNECKEIRNLLQGPSKQAADLTEEISRVQTLLDGLTRRRDELTTFIDAHLALLSPARRLPEDIIRAIFIACLPSTHNAVVSPAASPLLLCQICSAWRDLALSTPQLWASLHVVIPNTAKILHLAETANIWLSRSGVLPLSISLVVSKGFSHQMNASNDVSPLLASLALFAARWKNIRLVPAIFESFQELAYITAKDVPFLESISLATNHPLLPDMPPPWESLSLLAAKSLRRVFISGGSNHPSLRIVFAQLTHLVITYRNDPWFRFTSLDALVIMRQCSLLQTCKLVLSGQHVPMESSPVPVSLPYLWHLDVRDCTNIDAAHDIFTSLILPNVRSLSYANNIFAGSNAPSSIFLPTLERLQIHTEGLLSSDLIHHLQLVPLLRELELTGEPLLGDDDDATPGQADVTFLHSFQPDRDPVLCPNLRTLKLADFYRTSDQTLLDFVRARAGVDPAGPVACLAHFIARLDRPMTLDIKSALKPLIDSGLELSLRYPLPPRSSHSPWESVDESELNSGPFIMPEF